MQHKAVQGAFADLRFERYLGQGDAGDPDALTDLCDVGGDLWHGGILPQYNADKQAPGSQDPAHSQEHRLAASSCGMKTNTAARQAFNEAIRNAFTTLFSEAGISRNRWSVQSGVSENFPRQILDGAVESPTLEKAYLLCSGLDKTLWELLEKADPKGALEFIVTRLSSSDHITGEMIEVINAEMVYRRLTNFEKQAEQRAKEQTEILLNILSAIKELALPPHEREKADDPPKRRRAK